MLPTKPRSGLSDTSNNKALSSNLNHAKISRSKSTKSDSVSPSPLHKSRISPKSVDSKPTIIERRSPRFNISASDKQQVRVNEDLTKAKEQLALVEQEKARVLEELKDAKKWADEAMAAQKRAEERSEIEKFRADELEQASIDSIRKKEDELESIKKKHSLDAEALHSLTQELEKVKNELEVATKTKNTAVSQAEDANKIAKINSEKVDRLKSLLQSKHGSVNSETVEVIKKLESEVDALRWELERAKEGEEKLVIMESLVEKLSAEADNAKSAELDSLKLVDEWKKKAEELEIQLMEAKQSEKSSLESLALVRKQLEDSSGSLQDYKFEIGALREKIELLEDQLESQALISKQLEETNVLLQHAESEIAVLKGKVESLEIEVADLKKEKLEWKKRAEFSEVQVAEANQLKELSSESLASVTKQLEESHFSIQDALTENAALRMKIESLQNDITQYKEELMDSERSLDFANEEAIEMGKAIEGLKSEIKTLEEKLQSLNNASFSEERNKLLKELEMARKEEEKAKKAMEGLDSALREVSAEARETQERLFAKRVEHEDAFAQIEQLRLALQNTKENYEVMLDEARYEIVCLKKAIEKFDTEVNEAKSLNFSCEIKGPEEELKSTLSSAVDSEEKADELSAVVAEATTDKPEENGEFSNREKEYDVLPNSNEIPLGSINGSNEVKPKLVEEVNGNGNEYLGEEEPVEVEVKMLEGYKAIEVENGKDFSSEIENEEELVEEELELKMESGSFDNTNGLPLGSTEDGAISPTKQHKKKKPFIRKFGNLLKKKNTHN